MKKTIDEIVNHLKKEGASYHKKLGVESVGFGESKTTDNGYYTPIYLNIDRPIPGFVANEETGEYELGEVNTVFTSDIALNAILKREPKLKFLVRILRADVSLYEMLLADATIDIIGESVEENQEYVNPFSTLAEVKTVQHTSIYYNVVKINLGEVGLDFVKDMKKLQLEMTKDRLKQAMKKKSSIEDDDEDDDD